ncbi:MAG TPA: SurA N-terminal domain-containing protein [Stellaceae bacterium]|nr:SurA N-terminal domain-containing protein [Stellaceae bacterium]
MLQAIRSKATSFVVKILFGLLIVTFGIWGIGDIFRSAGPDTTVAKVGGRAITAEQLSRQVQSQLERMRGLFGGSIDAQQAKQLGVVDQALQGLIDGDLVELEIDRLGLAVGDEAVRDSIMANPAFHNQAGAFDRRVYAQVLLANQMSEPQFEALQRGALLKAQLQGALAAGITPPGALVDALYRARAERRIADMVTLPASAAGAIPAPTESQIDEFYRAHQDRFQAPERRSFKVAMLRLDDVAAGIELSDDQLKEEFQKRQGEFHTPEQRQVLQMLLPDEATAKVAAEQLAAGSDFDVVAKTVAKMDDPAALDLGWVKHDDLPEDLANAVFDLKEGTNSAPVNSTFGWHILHVSGIRPGEDKTFDQVKDSLKKEVARDRAADHMADMANSLDDAIAGGAGFDDVAKKFALKTATAADVDAEGKTAAGTAIDLPEGRDAILKTAFGTDRGQTSALSEMGDDGYYMVQVEAVTPAAAKPLAEVHDEAAQAWLADARQQALQKVADTIAQEVNGGRSLKDAAASRKLAVTTTPPLQRTGGDDKVPPSLVAKLFDAKPGAAVTEEAGDSVIVAQLGGVEPADPAQDQSAVKQLSQELGTVMQSDVLSEYGQALRQTFPVKVDQTNVDRLL